MEAVRLKPVYAVLCVLALLATACGMAVQPTPTVPPPTETATPLPPTTTPRPTATPRPTSTPNLAATQQYKSWESNLQLFVDAGYLDDSAGDFIAMDDFAEDWAQINWYKGWALGKTDGDFMFGGHFEWSTASSTPDVSGCGLMFGRQENEDHYAVFLDKGRILFLMGRGSHSYEVGKTSGSGRVQYGNPAEADFLILVKGDKAYVSVDGQMTAYTLSKDQVTTGVMAYTILSGTNRDYGTRCKITNAHLWQPTD